MEEDDLHETYNSSRMRMRMETKMISEYPGKRVQVIGMSVGEYID